jgi:hypothetical protein
MKQNTSLTDNQHFVFLCMTKPEDSVKRLSADLQKSRWIAVNALSTQLRDKLFDDKKLRAKTQVERRVVASRQRIELTLTGQSSELVEVVKKIKASATALGVHIETSLVLD